MEAHTTTLSTHLYLNPHARNKLMVSMTDMCSPMPQDMCHIPF